MASALSTSQVQVHYFLCRCDSNYFIVCPIFILLQNREDRSNLQSLWAGLDPGKVLYVIVLLVGYTLLLKPVGFLISTFFLLSLLFRIKGLIALKQSFSCRSSSRWLLYYFEIWLKAQLPKGILERIF